MSSVYQFTEGSIPLLISVPHDGRKLAANQAPRMTAAGQSLVDTDWHVARLYRFAHELGASMLVADYSRYVVDLNRPAEDVAMYPGRLSTGLCPVQTFGGEAIYLAGKEPNDVEKAQRVEAYWRPYHDKIRATLDAMVEDAGFALLWDAHSIPSVVPRLFEGELPLLNLGSYDAQSCAPDIISAVAAAAEGSSGSFVVDGRFKGGHITRNYGAPADRVCALQLEISQRAYMNESLGNPDDAYDEQAATALRATLLKMLETYVQAAERYY